MIVVTEPESLIFDFVSNGLFGRPDYFDRNHDKAIGIVKDNKLICGVVYTNYSINSKTGSPHSIEMSIFSIDKSWCNRHNLRVFFGYPFIQLGLKRVQTTCSADIEGVIMFNKRLGFKKEGYHREAFHDGTDAISWSMLKSECKWV